jgi:hypothetical protein
MARQLPIARIEKLMEAVLSVESSSKLYSEDPRPIE